MAKIQRLDPHLTNMIAAGEVVERPSGVVKELVENSIDAHASTIQVHVRQGGIEEMMIVDDGDGMSAQDATLSFERHATSKIKDVKDLWRISTMGFRGEALPSISSVAHVELKTNDGTDSTLVEIAYGKTIHAKPIGTPKGTQISVKNLFQRTPARFKHLRSASYEFSLVSDVIQKFALAYPSISFSLYHDDKRIFQSNGNGNMQEVMYQIYGREVAKAAIAVKGKDTDYQIDGYVVQPFQTRATKYYMLFFINNRMIRSYRLQKAIMDAYGPYIPSGRYPIVALHITMDPQLVDVNVHPSKWEVRFSKEKQLEYVIKETIQEALREKLEVNRVVKQEKLEIEAPTFNFEEVKKETPSVIYKQQTEPEIQVAEPTVRYQEVVQQTPVPEVAGSVTVEKDGIVKPSVQVSQKVEPAKVSNPSLPKMRALAQLHKAYILAEGDDGLYIIDQHAAQERYNFEVIKQKVQAGIKDQQDLLVPITLTSNLQAVSSVDQLNHTLEPLGIQFEVFGDNSFVVRSLPIWLVHTNEQAFLQDMVDFYIKNEEVDIEELRKHTLATMACHSSIRFNRSLSLAEMQQVITDLEHCEQPFHCPHGRPTFLKYTLKDLEKSFLRVK
ncbi:DNA mismatch repair protein MutL [Erysipelotrichaceae bacterium MTC7]|nr:DNA mismatch repair protein MutL [Erysipelotrichaceae bacterium MTC7]